MSKVKVLLVALASCLAAHSAWATATTGVISAGDTSWMLVSTALVMLMTPGLAFFYSGMVHSTNVVATIMHSYMKLCVITLVWAIIGYTLAFGTSYGGIVGGFDFFALAHVGQEARNATDTIPHLLFMLFQGMFAVITAAIITGAFAERVRLGPVIVFSTLWVILVYSPVAHWIWGGGWIAEKLKTLDFAGGAVVHINSGIAGLVAALCLGRRNVVTHGEGPRPHNLPLTILGAALLWFGWFGFNAGSALASGGLASLAFANTNIAAAAGAVSWFIIEYILKKKSTSLGIISGSIAGLVAITPAAGFVTPMASIAIGIGGGLVCFWAVMVLKPRLGYDDSLDAFGIHGIGGIWGAIATGLFATTSVNSAGIDGLFYGNPTLLWNQFLSIIAVAAYSGVVTFIILKLVRMVMPMRVSNAEELEGLDASQHGEIGYKLN